MAKINLGVMNCFAVKRWPEPEAWCRIIAETYGVRYVQFSLDLLDPRTLPSVRDKICGQIIQAIKKYDLHLTSTFTGLAAYSFNLLLHPDLGMRMDALDWYEKAIAVTAEMGAEGTGGHLGALSVEDYQRTTRRKYLMDFLIDALGHLSRVAKGAGLRFLLWEPMPCLREQPCTIKEAKKLYERVNKKSAIPVEFCLDLGHQCTVGISDKDRDSYEWLRQLGQCSPFIHIQQTDGQADHHWPFTRKYNERGIIEPPRVIEAINDSGAKEVTLLLEVIHPFEAEEKLVLTELRESVEFWKGYLS